MQEYTHCPKCNRAGSLAVAKDAVMTTPGPEGTLHVIGCTKCGWNRPSTHYKGITAQTELRNIVNPGTAKLAENVRRFS